MLRRWHRIEYIIFLYRQNGNLVFVADIHTYDCLTHPRLWCKNLVNAVFGCKFNVIKNILCAVLYSQLFCYFSSFFLFEQSSKQLLYQSVTHLYKSADLLIQEQQEYVREVFVENPTSAMLLLTAIANPARLDDFLVYCD